MIFLKERGKSSKRRRKRGKGREKMKEGKKKKKRGKRKRSNKGRARFASRGGGPNKNTQHPPPRKTTQVAGG